jgi:hypothetical protein
MLPVTEIGHVVPERTTTSVIAQLQPALRQTATWSQSAAGPASFLIRHFALAAGVLGFWRLGADIGWTQDFFIATGVWSHWQTWLALAAALNAAANYVQRAARRPDTDSR